MNNKFLAISIPTGIGLDIGGYAGDFGYLAREFSKYFKLIINPNAVNGGILSAINGDMLYTEGYALDEFLAGNINLKEVEKQNKIGIIFDKSIPQNILNIHINTINAMKIVEGYDILPYVITENEVGVEFKIDKKENVSSGNIKNPETLIEAGKKLIEQGADVLAVVCFFPDYDEIDDKNYMEGVGIDPIGGVEAIISHLLVKKFNVMSAHSPAFSSLDISNKIENKKLSSETISSTYLPCIIRGLAYAPTIVKNGGISCKDLAGFVVPSCAMGSKGVLGCSKNNIPIFAVQNKTLLNMTSQKMGISVKMEFRDYVSCLEYLKENL